MSDSHHQHHEAITKRLKRANGHLSTVISMIENDVPCAEVARQLQAVYKAIFNAKQLFIRDHIANRLSAEAIDQRPAEDINAELVEITKYL